MKATIDGESFSISATRVESIILRILKYLHCHEPKDRGKQVLIRLEPKELFEDEESVSLLYTAEDILDKMKKLADEVNAAWFTQISECVPFDEVNKLPLPDPRDVKLEVVMEGTWDGTGFVPDGPVFQILTKPWIGVIPLNSHGVEYFYSTFYVPV